MTKNSVITKSRENGTIQAKIQLLVGLLPLVLILWVIWKKDLNYIIFFNYNKKGHFTSYYSNLKKITQKSSFTLGNIHVVDYESKSFVIYAIYWISGLISKSSDYTNLGFNEV